MDGGTGTLLQKAGLGLGELPERWNKTHADLLRDIHAAYYSAGSHIVCANTFGANGLKYGEEELEELIRLAVENVEWARAHSKGEHQKLIALDIGPCGKLFKPYGDYAFEEGVALFGRVARLGKKYGADLVYIETMGDSLEMKAAVLGVKENCDLPIIASCAYGEDGKLTTGASPAAMVALLEGLRVDAIGANCSVGPKQMGAVVKELLEKSSLPVLVKPNAGLPTADGGYDISAEEFAREVKKFVEMGARLVGGCCGTTPAYIQALSSAVKDLPVLPVEEKQITCVSSYTHAVDFSLPRLIGERINPTGKKRFKQALKEGDVGYILSEGISQREKGAHILDVNVGAPEIDEKVELPRYIEELQAVLDLPLQIDTADPVALEKSMRLYNGKPLVNSVNGKKESMDSVFPLVKKYGGTVVALTLDERGIPDSVEGRLAIAERIIAEAARYGISKKDILVDPLAMAVSADKSAGEITLQTVRALAERGVKTSLGVSNISFGLPERETVNAVFFAQALHAGLTAGIINPNSLEMRKVYHAHLALHGLDENCAEYIRFAQENAPKPTENIAKPSDKSPLQSAIVNGLKEEAAKLTKALLAEIPPLAIVDNEIIPALDEVGRAYEEKQAFLPQLLSSGEAVKHAFEEIKKHLLQKGVAEVKKGTAILATVEGDIHDIGKNIVASLLENYGFSVVDLGRDVPAERVASEVEKRRPDFVGLSALMTTTLPSMERTVELLHARTPWVKILVGGAVVSEEYAQKIGADGYAKDGMSAVRFAESVCKE